VQTGVTLAFLANNEFSWLAYLMSFIWGFKIFIIITDSATNTHLAEMLGFEFENNAEPYSVFNLVQSIAVL